MFSDLSVSKRVDIYTLPLLAAAASGTVIFEMRIEVNPIGSKAYFALYKLYDVSVVSDSVGSSINSIAEQASFAFAKIASEVVVDGKLFRTCWNVKENVAC